MNAQPEYHVASYVAQTIPGQIDDVKSAISALDGAEVHATSDEGKLVFTIEGENQSAIGKLADEIKFFAGVLTLAPVYHQFLSEES